MTQIHGQATIRINGQVYESEDDASIKVGGIKNTTRMIGHKTFNNQTRIPSEIKCKIPVTAGISLTTFQGMSGAEVTFDSDVGTTYIQRDAAQTGEIEMAGGDSGGTIELTFTGAPAEEVR